MFLPPVVLAIRSRYVLEAAVYTFTMFFSTVCSGLGVFLHRVLIVVGEGLHSPRVVHEFGDVCTFVIWGCLEFTVSSTAALPTFSYHGMHRIQVIFVRHIGIMNKPL